MGWITEWHRWTQELAFRIVLKLLLWKQDLEYLIPFLTAAPKINSSSFSTSHRVNLRGCGSYKIIDAANHLNAVKSLQLAELLDGSESRRKQIEEVFDGLLSSVLPHLCQEIKLEDCNYYGCQVQKNAYLPVIHTDTDWLMFPGHDGFQLWYLLENDDEKNRGNMFMVKTDAITPLDPPVHFEMARNGFVVKKKADQWKYPVLGKWPQSSIKANNLLNFEYLDMKPGDCIIMRANSPCI